MKRSNKNYWLMLSMMVFAAVFASCGSDDGDPIITPVLQTLTADGIDLNGASSPNNVPQEAVITAVFNTAIDAATANATTITMMRGYDNTPVTATVSVSGSTVTVTPDDMISGVEYSLSFGAGILTAQGESVTPFTRTFTTEGTFTPAGQIAYFNFENNAEDQVGAYDATAEVAITYTASHSANAGLAATFDGDASIIEIPNGDVMTDTEKFTLSFWMKTNSENHVNANGDPAGQFVMGLAAFFGFQFEVDANYNWMKIPNWIHLSDGTTRGGGDLFWNGDGMNKDNGGWQGTTFNDEEDMPALIKDQWVHVTFVFDGEAQTRSIYVNGDLRISHDFSLWPDEATEKLVDGMAYGGTEPETYPELALGFVHSRQGTLWDSEPWGGYEFATANHFKGQLDDLRIFHTALTPQEVDLMYNSENQ